MSAALNGTPLRVALCGNPNVGKSTVFNRLTGLNQHTGNWTGKTVETARGTVRDEHGSWELTDLPGAYSLYSGSPEELLASDYLCFSHTDVVIVVCDATCLERNLNLALQAIEGCMRVVVCVNLLDEAEKRGIKVDLDGLSRRLGVPVVGTTARNARGLDTLKACVAEAARSALPMFGANATCENGCNRSSGVAMEENEAVRDAVEALAESLTAIPDACKRRFCALKLLADGERTRLVARERLGMDDSAVLALQHQLEQRRSQLARNGCDDGTLADALTACGYRRAREICAEVVQEGESKRETQLQADRLLASRRIGIPLMLVLLGIVFYITLWGANIPSAWLSELFGRLEAWLDAWLTRMGMSSVLRAILLCGSFRVTGWVVAVMLPPMAIFFPLFTFLEDWGLLPRVAFNLDRCFKRCGACGKQALCVCMGFGCNAVGVLGCRIIQSPRERLLAIITNSLTPCNGRFPTLIALLSMFFALGGGAVSSLWLTLLLLGLIVLSVIATLACSRLLSRTMLKGVVSSFVLEMAPFRMPRLGQVLVRSLLDRTLFVLRRAVIVAAPVGLIVWLLANIEVGGTTLFGATASFLDPFGRFFGMDGVIILAFLLGWPANEIVLPIMLMGYLSTGTLVEMGGLGDVRALLDAQGWSLATAACVLVVMLFHQPCTTTLITIWKETRSARWTTVAIVLPVVLGLALCMVIAIVARLAGG